MIINRRKLLVVFVLCMIAFTTACSGESAPEGESGQIISPTVFVTVFVTPVTATPLPMTPQPPQLPTQQPPPTYSDPNAPWNVPLYFPGPGCSASRLHVEDRAFVAATGALTKIYLSRNIPYDPGVRDLVPGEEMIILAGPYCDEDWVFWQVEMQADELTGWVPESDGQTYYLLPVVGGN
jgi:hypothetical protein